MNKKKKSTNTSPYPDEVIDRLARAFYPAILACWNSEEGQREFAAWQAERWQFLINVGEILGAAGHIGIKAALHFGNDQNSPVGAGQVFGLGIAQPAGAVVSQAMQQVHHWRGGQISGIRHGNKHRCCHAERFRHDVTAEKCHGLPLLQICGFASARQTARMAGSVRSQALTVLAAKG